MLWQISFTKKHIVVAKFFTEKFVAMIGTLGKGDMCVHGSRARKMVNSPVIRARR